MEQKQTPWIHNLLTRVWGSFFISPFSAVHRIDAFPAETPGHFTHQVRIGEFLETKNPPIRNDIIIN